MSPISPFYFYFVVIAVADVTPFVVVVVIVVNEVPCHSSGALKKHKFHFPFVISSTTAIVHLCKESALSPFPLCILLPLLWLLWFLWILWL